MNHIFIRTTIPCALIFFCCWNGTLVDSGSKSKRPDVNFYGTIEDHTGKIFYAQDLLINGRYEGISVYPTLKNIKKHAQEKSTCDCDEARTKTTKTEIVDPTQNKALLDLAEIKTIELKHPEHPTASTVNINNKDFIEIIVTSINGTQKHYLVESSRKITCKEIDKGPEENKKEVLVERELNMIHIKKLTIDGHKSAKDSDDNKNDYHASEKKSKPDEKKEVSQHTEKLLDQITENVKNLSQESPSTFEKMKSNIIGLLKSLREQLQKMLNMLQ